MNRLNTAIRTGKGQHRLRRRCIRKGIRRFGFTLLELMLVVTLISIILTIAIPGFMSSRKYANEASAISSLRSISSVQNIYRIRFGTFGSMMDLTSSGFVDNAFADGERSGYAFSSSNLPSSYNWAISAQPINPGVTGDRWFYVDESGVIRSRDGAAATTTDSALQ